MSNLKFPSFNFPYTPCENLRQFLVDYGRTGAVHVFKDGENIECISQKKEMDKNANAMIRMSEKLTLPINLPGKLDRELKVQPQAEFQELWDCQQPVTDLTADHGEVVFGGIAELIGAEAVDSPWFPPMINTQRLQKFDPILNKLDTNFCDLPLDLMTSLVQKSMEEDKVTTSGKYCGNCLAYAESTLQESDVVVVYPGGAAMSELCFSHLENDGSSIRLSKDEGSFPLTERICQVSMGTEVDQSHIISVRTSYKCWFFKTSFGKDFEKPVFLGNLQCKTKPCAITPSPYVPEEVIVAMETGSLWLWNAEDGSVEVVRQCSSCTSDEFDWYFSDFGSHPRQVVRGNQTNVELIDLRGGSSTSQDLMTLPSPHFFPDDKFTAIQHYHENPYHYILASTQSLAIMDTRFQQNPVLKWCHSLEYPVKHINVLPDPTSQDMLVFVGSYQSHDVHCFQYCYGENWSSPLSIADDMSSILPPRSTSNPWKISSYSEWAEMVDYPNKAQSHHKVSERLSHPLLGLSCIPTTATLAVVQLSNAGDLFYENLYPPERKLREMRDERGVQYFEDFELDFNVCGGCGSKRPRLEKDDEEFLAKWVKCLVEQTDEEEDTLGGNCNAEDVSIIREGIFSSFKIDVNPCSLCSSKSLGDCSGGIAETAEDHGNASPGTNETEKSSICPCCNLTRESSDRLSKVRTSGRTALTNEYLGLSCGSEPLQMFDEGMQCSEPLGIVLLKNWYSDEEIPIDLGGQNETAEIDKKELVEMYLEKNRESAESPASNKDGNIRTPTRETPARKIELPMGDRRGIIKTPERSPNPGQVLSKLHLRTPDSAISERSRKSRPVEDKTPNLMKTPQRNALNQSRTPTKKKITRVAGF